MTQVVMDHVDRPRRADVGRSRPLRLSRRQVLGGGLGLAGAAALAACGGTTTTGGRPAPTPGSDLGAVEHVVFLMQENRSFDHYFGAYPGVRGFSDVSPDASARFRQPWPGGPVSSVLPFHLTEAVPSICAGSYSSPDIEWVTQHSAWAGGQLDGFLSPSAVGAAGSAQAPLTMGYLTRQDLGFYYALADAFTICDHYFCSVLGPTMPNRLYWLSGTIDPSGRHGGPVVDTPAIAKGPDAWGSCDWDTMPEVLLDHGVSWKVYQPAGTATGTAQKSAPSTSFNALSFFKQYVKNPTSELAKRAFSPTWPDDFTADVRAGRLPSVSWLLPPLAYSEHPSTDPQVGEWFVSQVLSTLWAEPDLWSKTVVLFTYDENGGFFDHVTPPTPPAGTPGELLTTAARTGDAGSFEQPIGLGFRVPTLVISPWSRGGWIDSETFDHTSMLRFLEERFGVEAPNITSWRRETVGDLTSTLDFKKPDSSLPALPATKLDFAPGCPTPQNLGPFFGPAAAITLPAMQQMPTQEPGAAHERT